MTEATLAQKPLERFSPANCICSGMGGEEGGCACTHQERGLRAVMAGAGPMTPEEREWCLAEIDRVEGHSRHTYQGTPDAEIARGVMDAWIDFCRDKGLL